VQQDTNCVQILDVIHKSVLEFQTNSDTCLRMWDTMLACVSECETPSWNLS